MEERILKKFNYPFWARNETIIPTEYGWERVLKNGRREILVAYRNLKTLLEQEVADYKKEAEKLAEKIEERKKIKVGATVTAKNYRQAKTEIYHLFINFPYPVTVDITNGKSSIKVIKERNNGEKEEIVAEAFNLKRDPEVMETYNLQYKIRVNPKEEFKLYINEDAVDLGNCVLRDREQQKIDEVVLEPKILKKELDFGDGTFETKIL